MSRLTEDGDMARIFAKPKGLVEQRKGEVESRPGLVAVTQGCSNSSAHVLPKKTVGE